jgi:hypothetical protein
MRGQDSATKLLRCVKMSLSTFVCELFETGRVRVAPPSLLSASRQAEADETLVAFERDFRRELPAEAPPFSLAAARWGALAVFHACQFLVYRDADAKLVAETLTVACPESPNPATHYSVDLVLRFLPDAARLARGVNPKDPLVEHLQRLASHWPLSSVGMSDITPVSLSGVVDHPCLLAMYVDRVIAARDIARLADSRVRMAVRAAIGLHDQLAPEVAAALRIQETEESLL